MARLRNYLRQRKQEGFVVSAELIFIVTILVIGLIVGWVAIRNAVVFELHDVAEAVGSLDQGYQYSGTNGLVGVTATTTGSLYFDVIDQTTAGDNALPTVNLPLPTDESTFP